MMNNEEFDRKMEFLVNQQAQFDADMQELREAQKITEQNLNRAVETLAQTQETLAELTTLTTEGFKWTIQRFNAIAEDSKHTDAKIDALVNSQIETAEFIRNIGSKLDRHLNEDHSSA
jgi:Lon protease-like protein